MNSSLTSTNLVKDDCGLLRPIVKGRLRSSKKDKDDAHRIYSRVRKMASRCWHLARQGREQLSSGDCFLHLFCSLSPAIARISAAFDTAVRRHPRFLDSSLLSHAFYLNSRDRRAGRMHSDWRSPDLSFPLEKNWRSTEVESP